MGGVKLQTCLLSRAPSNLVSVPGIGHKIEVQENIHKDFHFCQAIFALPVKVTPMARAMPAIP